MNHKITFLLCLCLLCFASPKNLSASVTDLDDFQVTIDSLIFPEGSATDPHYGIHGGDLFLESLGGGIILTASTGTCWEIVIAGDGTITTDSVACPAGINPVDGDGNLYDRLVIGNQTWLAQSLYSSTYRDGTAITKMVSNADIQDKTVDNPVAGYVNWQFIDSNGPEYGSLYNHLVTNPAINGGHEVCPTGYKLPSVADYQELTTFLEPGASNNSTNTVGSKLKIMGNQSTNSESLWLNQNTDATNSSGFTAQPGSYFLPVGFNVTYASFWLSDVDNGTSPPSVNSFSMVNNNTWSTHGPLPNNFLYLSKIRCIEE